MATKEENDISYWYCHECQIMVDRRNVTFHETHDTCGSIVKWTSNSKLHQHNNEVKELNQQLAEANALIDVLNDFALRVKNALPDNSILGVAAKKHCEKVNEYKTKQTTGNG